MVPKEALDCTVQALAQLSSKYEQLEANYNRVSQSLVQATERLKVMGKTFAGLEVCKKTIGVGMDAHRVGGETSRQ